MGHSLSNTTQKKQIITQAVIFGVGLFALFFLVLMFVNGYSVMGALFISGVTAVLAAITWGIVINEKRKVKRN
ncbi:hypothetical protein [uncultured Capnocytophaga sp.]|uniref:hypothetical protein n=1 Tax=uncultured Capnocytophaga sp. TaxID=159273 RepID=UPI002611ACE0|nr:hypothetical protein [uncultured Capnocytophaga sp.]